MYGRENDCDERQSGGDERFSNTKTAAKYHELRTNREFAKSKRRFVMNRLLPLNQPLTVASGGAKKTEF